MKEKAPSARLLYLCTTFPRPSETFIQREVRVLRQKFSLDIRSLWHGEDSFESLAVHKFPLSRLGTLFFWLPYWLIRRPEALVRIFTRVWRNPPSHFLNWEETLLGLATGLIFAREVEKKTPEWIHAVWATMPATSAWMIHALTDKPFSFGAHAYDLFQHGGDCLLTEKIRDCDFVHTTTHAAASRLTRKGCPPGKIQLIRRGLNELPPARAPRPPELACVPQILSVGRIIPKKGYRDQIRIYGELKARGFPFRATIAGDGPLLPELRNAVREGELEDCVEFAGWQSPEGISKLLAESDFFFFTGVISPDGDRDGLPNVIPEAMAGGLTVIARSAPGVREVLTDGETGRILPDADPDLWCQTLTSLWEDRRFRKKIAGRARTWVEENFIAETNTGTLAERIREHIRSHKASAARDANHPQ